MLLCKKGQKKYFDPDLLKRMKSKINTKVVKNVLLRYSRNQRSLKLHRLKDSLHATLLHYAADYGNADIADYLLKSKCDVDAQDRSGRTALMLAATGGHEQVFDILLEAKANVSLTDCHGNNALELIFNLKSSTLRASMLTTLFRHASWRTATKGIAPDDLVRKLDEVGYTMKNALQSRNATLMKVLLRRGYSINVPETPDGGTLLHLAIQRRMLREARVLIDCGADVDALDRWEATPLFYLYKRGFEFESAKSLRLLKVLVSRATLLTASTYDRTMQIFNLLRHGDDEAINLILQHCSDFYATDAKGRTMLHYLARNRDIDLFAAMRGRKYDVDARDNDGYTPLHEAAASDAIDAMKFLLERGADANAVSTTGETPLYNLSSCGFSTKPSAEILLQYGADPQVYVTNLHSYNGCTYFDMIVRRSEDLAVLVPGYDNSEYLVSAEPFLARLALIEALGVEITELVRSKIRLQPSWIEYFDKCQRLVEQMKKTTIYGNVSLFDFLTESEKKMTAYARNKELVSALEKLVEKFEAASPYFYLLQSRFQRAIQLAQLKEKATAAIYELSGLKNNAHYLTVECIVEYLRIQDMENLHLAWKK